MFTPQGKPRKRAANPVDGYVEDRYGVRSEDELVDRADVCESEDDSDSDLDRKFKNTAAYKQSFKDFRKQAKPRGDINGKSDQNDRSNNKSKFDQKILSGDSAKRERQRSISTKTFGTFGSKNSTEDGKRKGISDDSTPMDDSGPLQEVFDFDFEEGDVEETAPQKTSSALEDFVNANTATSSSGPLADFLAAKPSRSGTVQPDVREESSPDPISNPLEGAQNNVSRKTRSQGRSQWSAMARPKTRALLKQQLKDQDKEKKEVRRSARNSGGPQPSYGKTSLSKLSKKGPSVSASAKKAKANAVPASVAYKMSEWPKKLDAGKIFVDLRGIDRTQYVRY